MQNTDSLPLIYKDTLEDIIISYNFTSQYFPPNLIETKSGNMKILLTSLIIFLHLGLAADIKEKSVNSTIRQVTVFESGAQVSRTASTNIPQGNSILKFVDIAPHILSNSIQVKGTGDFTILSVKYNQNYLNKAKMSDELEFNESKIKSIKELIEDKQSLLLTLREEYNLITSNKSIGGQQGVNVEDLKSIAAFYQVRLKEIKQEELSISRQIIQLNKELEDFKKQKENLSRSFKDYTSEVIINIESKKATKADFTLSYLIKNAGWFANYDARVKDVNSPVELLYKGRVYQTSGEDWKNVNLTLSTGNPQENALKPTISTWWIGYQQKNYQTPYYQPGAYSGLTWSGNDRTVSGIVTDSSGEPLIGANIILKGTSTGTITNIDGTYTLQVPAGDFELVVSYVGYNNFETRINSNTMNIVLDNSHELLSEVVVTSSPIRQLPSRTVSALSSTVAGIRNREYTNQEQAKSINLSEVDNTTSIEFKIENPYTIPSDGQQYSVKMVKHFLEADYEYYCVPKLNSDAFLTAEIPDWSGLHLLTGELNIFFKDSYLGKSMLNANNLSDTLSISLGVDKDIVVQRTKIKDLSKRRVIGLKKIESRSWNIDILNKKNQPIRIVIKDQFPIATNEDISVDRINYGGAELDEDSGILTWTHNLSPGASKETNFAYSIKYNKKKYIHQP